MTGSSWQPFRNLDHIGIVGRQSSVMAGVDIRTAQEMMGHKTIRVTMRYAHPGPAHQLEAIQRLCNTGSVRNRATDTRTDTMPLELLSDGGETELSPVPPAT